MAQDILSTKVYVGHEMPNPQGVVPGSVFVDTRHNFKSYRAHAGLWWPMETVNTADVIPQGPKLTRWGAVKAVLAILALFLVTGLCLGSCAGGCSLASRAISSIGK